MSSSLLKVDSLSLVTGQGHIVKDFSFEIRKGEIIALTGKSGSGKTSIAMAILGLLPPGITHLDGQIIWFPDENPLVLPKDIERWPSLRGTHIGFTQQDVYGAFDPVLRMGKQMMMVVKERSQTPLEDIEKEIRLKMEESGLHDLDRLWNSYPHQLSGGQLQRCQICMAMVIKPELLITDEPTSAIDKINQSELLDLFSKLRSLYQITILCISHEESVVRYLADREIRIDKPEEVPKEMPFLKERNKNDNSPPILLAEKLCYAYRFGGLFDKRGAVVGPLNFSIQSGHCLGIMGASGSGKSTLAQLLVGFLGPESGSLKLDGKEIHFNINRDISSLRTAVQLVMQDGRGSLHPYLTIQRLLEEVVESKKQGDPHTLAHILQVLKDVDLPESVLKKKPSALSGGECLRVSIARALLMSPRVLVCDESTSALDGKTRDGIIRLLKQLMESRSLAILFISHDELLIRALADTLLVMEQGKIIEYGPAGEVIQYPTHTTTKRIFSSHATLSGKRRL